MEDCLLKRLEKREESRLVMLNKHNGIFNNVKDNSSPKDNGSLVFLKQQVLRRVFAIGYLSGSWC